MQFAELLVLEGDLYPPEEVNWLQLDEEPPSWNWLDQVREDEWDYLRSTGYAWW